MKHNLYLASVRNRFMKHGISSLGDSMFALQKGEIRINIFEYFFERASLLDMVSLGFSTFASCL